MVCCTNQPGSRGVSDHVRTTWRKNFTFHPNSTLLVHPTITSSTRYSLLIHHYHLGSHLNNKPLPSQTTMAKKKPPTTKNAKTATAKPPKQVTAPSSPQPHASNTRPLTRSTVPQSNNEAANGENMGENEATSSNEGNAPNPNRSRTRTANTHQHPGELHNIYKGKRRTKEEMVEARRNDAIKKAMRAEEAERQAMEREDSVRRIAEYEVGLGQMNVDDTPII